ALGIGAAGLLGLWSANERTHHLATVTVKDSELASDIRRNLLYAVRAQKNAAISTDDKQSHAFADQSRAAAKEVERLRQELVNRRGTDPSMVIRQALETFNRKWQEYQPVEAEVLELAVANSNAKAEKICHVTVVKHLGDFEAALESLGNQVEKRAE